MQMRMLLIVNKALSISLTIVLMLSVVGVTVNTHYCHGAARYSAIATDADHQSCCGDEMNACPSCEDRVSSNVMDSESVITAVPEPVAPESSIDTAFAEATIDASSLERTNALAAAGAKSPPGHFSGITLPVLFQSLLN